MSQLKLQEQYTKSVGNAPTYLPFYEEDMKYVMDNL